MSTTTQHGRIVPVTDENWQEEIFQSPTPVLVDFYGDWCAPCKALLPHVEALAEKAPWLKVTSLNVSTYPAIAAQMHVQSLPTLLLVKGGTVRGYIKGRTTAALLDEIQQCLGN